MKHIFIHNGRGWWLKISTIEEMCDYLDVEWDRRKQEALADRERVKKGYHSSNYLCGIAEVLKKFHGGSFELALDSLQEQLYKDWYNFIYEGKTIFVNGVGGYTLHQDIKKVYTKDDYEFPVFSESDIRIKKWPYGSHYYAYIGDMIVTDGETMKWNTEERAREIAMRYVNRKVKGGKV